MLNDRYKLNIDKLVYQRKSEKDTATKSSPEVRTHFKH